MEVRWQGLRDIMKFDKEWRRKINELYRETALVSYLRKVELLDDIHGEQFDEIAENCLFEIYGPFDWNVNLRWGKTDESFVARVGEYPDGLLLIRSGFGSNSKEYGNVNRIITYLSAGDKYCLEELYSGWKNPDS